MDIINVDNLEFNGVIRNEFGRMYHEKLKTFSHNFSFGRSFLLSTEIAQGGWAVSWIVGGELEPLRGTLSKNGQEYKASARKADSWLVRKSEIKTFWMKHQTVQMQILHGLQKNHQLYHRSEDELKQQFQLTDERYQRPLHQLSHEAWRASCAIGLANGKKIFCFPYVESSTIEEYYNLWFKDIVNLLKEAGCMVLIPSLITERTAGLCDEIVIVNDSLQNNDVNAELA